MLFQIANALLANTSGAESAVSQMANETLNTVKAIVKAVMPALFGVVSAIGVVYGVMLGIQYAKAEDSNKRDEAKKRLVNAIIGFGIAIIAAAIMWILASMESVWSAILN